VLPIKHSVAPPAAAQIPTLAGFFIRSPGTATQEEYDELSQDR
jgi:hypothetical protein